MKDATGAVVSGSTSNGTDDLAIFGTVGGSGIDFQTQRGKLQCYDLPRKV